jgi:hypothetical protein
VKGGEGRRAMGIRLNLLCNGQIAKDDKFRDNYEEIWPCEDELGRNLMDKSRQDSNDKTSKD